MPNSEEPTSIWGQRLKLDVACTELEKLGIAKNEIDTLFPLLHSTAHRTEEGSLTKTPEGKILVTGMGIYGFSDVKFVYRYDPEKKTSVVLFEFEHGTFGTVTKSCKAAETLPLDKRALYPEVLEGLCKFLEADQEKVLAKFPLMKDFPAQMMLRMGPHTAILAVNAATGAIAKGFVYEYHVATDETVLISSGDGRRGGVRRASRGQR